MASLLRIQRPAASGSRGSGYWLPSIVTKSPTGKGVLPERGAGTIEVERQASVIKEPGASGIGRVGIDPEMKTTGGLSLDGAIGSAVG